MTTTCAATAVAAVALGRAFTLRTEVTKLASKLSVEAVFEADLDTVARRSSYGGAVTATFA